MDLRYPHRSRGGHRWLLLGLWAAGAVPAAFGQGPVRSGADTTDATGGAASGSAWHVPYWKGVLSGRVSPRGESGPALQWTVTPRVVSEGRREVKVELFNTTTRVRVRLEVDAVTGDGTWEIEEAHGGLESWVAAELSKLSKALAGTTLTGEVAVSGRGTLHQGRPEGRVVVTISQAEARHPAGAWALSGVGLRGEFAVARDLSLTSVRPLELTIRQVTTPRFGLSNVFVAAELERAAEGGGERVSVREAQLEAAGGHVTLEPFSVDLAEPAVALKMAFRRIGLQDVAAFVPESVSEATGRVDGELRARWNPVDGFRLGDGWLALNDTEPTILRLARAPGLLTAQLPERVLALPAWWPAWLGGVVPRNPAYVPLKDLELGKTRLRVKSLRINITPDGDRQGRTASVQVVTHPDEAGLLPEITFNVRVGGPLEALLQLGMNDRVQLGLDVGVP